MSLDGPELRPPHARALPIWLEWLTSISALVISVSSIFIAVHNGHNEDKMVQAQSFPYLEISRDNATPEGETLLSLNLLNEGVGPAHQQSLRVRVGDRYVTSVQELIDTVLGPTEAHAALGKLGVTTNVQPTRFLPANKTQFIFKIRRTEANARWWTMIDKSRPTWRVDVCYCSVFKDCWVRHDDHEPTPVAACKRDEPHEFN
jgi:hypothetical protein